jgi:hypothetical protein
VVSLPAPLEKAPLHAAKLKLRLELLKRDPGSDILLWCGRLAQLVERLPYKEDVGGSSPSSPILIRLERLASHLDLFLHRKHAETAEPIAKGNAHQHQGRNFPNRLNKADEAKLD